MSTYAKMWAGYLVMVGFWIAFATVLIGLPQTMRETPQLMVLLFVGCLGLPLLLVDIFKCPHCGEPPLGGVHGGYRFGLGLSLIPPSRFCRTCAEDLNERL